MSLFFFGNIIYEATNLKFPILGNIFYEAIRRIIDTLKIVHNMYYNLHTPRHEGADCGEWLHIHC